MGNRNGTVELKGDTYYKCDWFGCNTICGYEDTLVSLDKVYYTKDLNIVIGLDVVNDVSRLNILSTATVITEEAFFM